MNYINRTAKMFIKEHPATYHLRGDTVVKRILNNVRFLLLITLLFCSVHRSEAITYYSRTSGNWSSPSSWSTTGYGLPVNTGTTPQAGDDVFIGLGHVITLDNSNNCDNVTIGQIGTGHIQYTSVRTVNFRIAFDLSIGPASSVTYSGNASRNHWMYVGRDISNRGTLSVFPDPNDFVELVFNRTTNSAVYGTGTFVLNRVTMLKLSPVSNRLDIRSTTFENGIRELIVTSGYYIHNNTSAYIVNPALTNFTITRHATIEVPMGSMHFSPTSTFLYLNGSLILNGGTVRVGSPSGTQGLRYEQVATTVPRLIINSGHMEVTGGITYRAITPTSSFHFEMNGGTLLLNTGAPGTRNGTFVQVDNPLSSFIMTAGVITMQRPTRDPHVHTDFEICGTTGTVNATMGLVEFGNTATASGAVWTFKPALNAILPNFRVTGSPGNTGLLVPFNNNTSDIIFNSLHVDINKTFDVRANISNNGVNRNIRFAGNYDGLHTIYNDGTANFRSAVVTIQGYEGLWLGGTNDITFYRLIVNNFFGVSLATDISITDQLTLTDGIVYVNPPYTFTCQANARANSGNNNAYVDGFFSQVIAGLGGQTFDIPVGRNNIWRPMVLTVRHSNANPATYSSEMLNIPASSFNYALPATLGYVSHVRYYNIQRSAESNFVVGSITLSYGPDDGVTDHLELRVAQHDGAGTWIDEGGTGTANGTGSITSTSFFNFNGMFTLANTINGSNPLPVTLLDFDAESRDSDVLLKWSTATEINASHFEVESSPDADNFLTAGTVLAHGNSSETSIYSFIDHEPTDGVQYYRLKMVDNDGTYEYSPVRVVLRNAKPHLNISPNPVYHTDPAIRIPVEFPGISDVQIISADNRIVHHVRVDGGICELPLSDFAKGTYTVIIRSADRFKSGRFVVL